MRSCFDWHGMDERPDLSVGNMVYVRTGRWNLSVVPVKQWQDRVESQWWGRLKGEPICWCYAHELLEGAACEPKYF